MNYLINVFKTFGTMILIALFLAFCLALVAGGVYTGTYIYELAFAYGSYEWAVPAITLYGALVLSMFIALGRDS